MVQFTIGERCLFWEPNGKPLYGTVIKINPDTMMVLIQTDDGCKYLKQSSEVIKAYGRSVV